MQDELMRLYHSPTSPYVRKIMVLLHETGQLGDVTLVPASGTPLDPGTVPLEENPLGKVPVLARPDGPPIFDSRAICRYLDARAGGRVYPQVPALWETLTLEAMGDGIVDAAILIVYETRLRPEEMRSRAWMEGQWAKIDRTLTMLDREWGMHLGGADQTSDPDAHVPNMGQIAVACALAYLDFRHAAREWRTGRPQLAAWFDTFATRPAMTATAPPA